MTSLGCIFSLTCCYEMFDETDTFNRVCTRRCFDYLDTPRNDEIRDRLTFGNPDGLLVVYVGRLGPEKVSLCDGW